MLKDTFHFFSLPWFSILESCYENKHVQMNDDGVARHANLEVDD